MATVALHQDLVGARASFQRLRDAKILHGWIESLDGSVVVVKANSTVVFAIGDRFAFRSACLTGDVAFEATLRQCANEDGATLLALATKGRTVLDLEEQTLVFELDGRLTSLPATGDPRYLCIDGTVCLGGDGLEASLRDVSPGGLGVLSPAAIPRGDILTISVFTSAGRVVAEAEVRYCRRVGTSPEVYRIGLKLSELDRVNRARWNTLISRP